MNCAVELRAICGLNSTFQSVCSDRLPERNYQSTRMQWRDFHKTYHLRNGTLLKSLVGEKNSAGVILVSSLTV